MSAALRVTNDELRRLMAEWKGNVAAVADAAGITRKALYERLERMGLDPDACRDERDKQHAAAPAAVDSMATLAPPGSHGPLPGGWGVSGLVATLPAGVTHVPESQGDGYAASGEKPTFSNMSSAANAETQPAPSPVKASVSRTHALRVTPEHRERIRQLRFALTAAYRTDFDDSGILGQLIEDCLDVWGRRMLEPAVVAAPVKSRKKTEKA
jgi:hypothetical protein